MNQLRYMREFIKCLFKYGRLTVWVHGSFLGEGWNERAMRWYRRGFCAFGVDSDCVSMMVPGPKGDAA